MPMKENYMKMKKQEELFLVGVLSTMILQYGNVQNAINKFGKEIVININLEEGYCSEVA